MRSAARSSATGICFCSRAGPFPTSGGQVLDSRRHPCRDKSAGVNATISLGIGKDGSSFEENYSFANLSIEMALSRGGDQAVIKDRYNFTFYGGRTKETERRTRVKSRVVAGSLSELISQSSKVFVMGHKMADLDALGAAVGISCLCRKRGKTAQIVIDLEKNASQSLLAELKASNDFSGVFVSCEDALFRGGCEESSDCRRYEPPRSG